MFGKWGVAPMASMGDLRAKASSATTATVGKEKEREKEKEDRPTGVNQKGSLRALRQAQVRRMEREGARVEVFEGVVDEGLLAEMLGEG